MLAPVGKREFSERTSVLEAEAVPPEKGLVKLTDNAGIDAEPVLADRV